MLSAYFWSLRDMQAVQKKQLVGGGGKTTTRIEHIHGPFVWIVAMH